MQRREPPLPSVATAGHKAAPRQLPRSLLPQFSTSFRPATGSGVSTGAPPVSRPMSRDEQRRSSRRGSSASSGPPLREFGVPRSVLATTTNTVAAAEVTHSHAFSPSPTASNFAPSASLVASASVPLRERMAGGPSKRRPDPNQIATAMLVGGAKQEQAAAAAAAGQRPGVRAASAAAAGDRSASSAAAAHDFTAIARSGFQRTCCTPPVDRTVTKRGEALEALLTAGEYEAGFNNGRAAGAVSIEETERATDAEGVARLRVFDRSLKKARNAVKREQQERQRQPTPRTTTTTTTAGQDGKSARLDTSATSTRAQFVASIASSAAAFAPPRVIQLVFRLGTVRNLPATKALQRIGYPELHEQFSVVASATGMIYKTQYLDVLSAYLTPHEHADSLRILECFSASAHGDVELPLFLVGLQLLLECATPGDTLRYCFQLLDSNSAVPRYMTRFEAQTLVTYADESARIETRRVLERQGRPAADIEAMSSEELVSGCGDRSFLAMRGAILHIVGDAGRYDYCGRMPLKDFLVALEDELAASEDVELPGGGRRGGGSSGSMVAMPAVAVATSQSRSAVSNPGARASVLRQRLRKTGSSVMAAVSLNSTVPTSPKLGPTTPSGADPTGAPSTPALSKAQSQSSPFVFGRAWQGGGALVHRISSKKMIIASLTPQQAEQRQHQQQQLHHSQKQQSSASVRDD